MHSLKNILLLLLFLSASVINAQDSTNTFPSSPNFSSASSDYTDYYFLSLLDQRSDPPSPMKLQMASQPIFVNSERPLVDGTLWRENSDIDYWRLSSMAGLMLTVNMVALNYQMDIWYTEETTVFHSLDFVEDWGKYQQMDKFGHFADAYFTSDLSGKIYRWSGMSGNSSVWFGALTGWLWMLEIEMNDAFMSDWGFSWGDMLANTAGSAFYVLQQFNYDLLGGIHPKFSWHKSDAWKEMRYNTDPKALIEDYEGLTFWVTVNPHHYFPDSWKKTYPEWLAPLGLAFGVSAKDIGINPWGGYKEYFVGLDIDLRKLPIWGDLGMTKFIVSEINFLRLPLPVIRFSSQGTWVGFYF